MEYTCQMLTPGNGLPCRHYLRPEKSDEPGFCQQQTQFFCIEAMERKLPAISYSRLSDFIHCKQRYYHGMIEGLRVKPEHIAEPLKLGSAWDAYTRHIYEPEFDHHTIIDPLQLSPVQYTKISALAKAYQDSEIRPHTDELLGCQYKVYMPVGQQQITGRIDRAYENHIVEVKLSAKPDFYTQKENLAYQLGTYFMANEAWEYGTVEITRVPYLKTGQGKYSDESAEAYQERIYGDILSRPTYYFLGWDRKTRTYGVRFWRSEFDLEEIFKTYVHVLREIQETVRHGSWYQNNLACHIPAPCPYLPIKRGGVVSDEIYERRVVKQNG